MSRSSGRGLYMVLELSKRRLQIVSVQGSYPSGSLLGYLTL